MITSRQPATVAIEPVSHKYEPVSHKYEQGVKCTRRREVGDMSETLRETSAMERVLLREELVDWFNRESELLDDQRYEEWLDLLTDDIRYEMPLRLNVPSTEMHRERTKPGSEVCWFDEGKTTLISRVSQLGTHLHWAEEPLSRVTRVISNVRVAEQSGDEVTVRCAFLLYRNRVNAETDILVGRRRDTLRRVRGHLLLSHRYITLDQSVLMAKNLTVLF